MISRLGMLLCYFWSDGMIIHGEPSCWCRWCINHCLNDDAPISDTVEFILQFLGGLHRVFPLSKDQDVIRKWQGSAHTRYLVLRDHHGIHVKQIWEQGWALWQFRENGWLSGHTTFLSYSTDDIHPYWWRKEFTSRDMKMLTGKSTEEGIYLEANTNLSRIYLQGNKDARQEIYWRDLSQSNYKSIKEGIRRKDLPRSKYTSIEESIYLKVNTNLLRKGFISR